MVGYVLLTLVTVVAMEPVSAGIHRFFGHGPGWFLHRSHHDGDVDGWEANDLIPVGSATVTMGLFWLGVTQPDVRFLVPIALGATIYGAIYFVLHDLYIHRRIPVLPERIELFEPIRRAHLEHHETGIGHWGILSGYRSGRDRQLVS